MTVPNTRGDVEAAVAQVTAPVRTTRAAVLEMRDDAIRTGRRIALADARRAAAALRQYGLDNATILASLMAAAHTAGLEACAENDVEDEAAS